MRSPFAWALIELPNAKALAFLKAEFLFTLYIVSKVECIAHFWPRGTSIAELRITCRTPNTTVQALRVTAVVDESRHH